MLFVKKEELSTQELVEFEVITRGPLTNKIFSMSEEIFDGVFSNKGHCQYEVDLGNAKEDIYNCIDKRFKKSLMWWNQNVVTITPLFENVYESEKSSTESFRKLSAWKNTFKEELGGDSFTFSNDFKFFRELFDTAKPIEGGKDYDIGD